MDLTIDQALEAAMGALKADNFDEARRLYGLIIEVQPNHPDSNHNLGVLNVMAGATAEAIRCFRTALKANPKAEQFWLSYIQTLVADNQLHAARKALNQGLNSGLSTPNQEFLQNLIDTASPKSSQMKSAFLPGAERKALSKKTQGKSRRGDKASAIEPLPEELASAMNFYNEGKFDNAIKLASALTSEFPNHAPSWLVLSAALNQKGEVTSALHAARECVRLFPENPEGLNNLAVILKRSGKPLEAVSRYQQLLELNPDFAPAHFNLALTFLDLERFTEAKDSCLRAIKLDRRNIDAHYNLGVIATRLGQFPEAEEAYRAAIFLDPSRSNAHTNLGFLLQQTGRLSEAKQSTLEAISLDPEQPDPHFNLGNIFLDKEEFDDAQECFETAIRLRPSHAKSHSQLGCAIHGTGDDLGAIQAFQRSHELDPSNRTNYARLAILKTRQNREPNPQKNRTNTDCAVNRAGKYVTSRVVEPDLIETLYQMASRDFENTADTRYGFGRCSLDFELLEHKSQTLNAVAADLTEIMSQAVSSDIYCAESFFNILTEGGGGTTPHRHIREHDRPLGIGDQKYSLVYYISVGDQSTSEPGSLILLEPDENILPTNGMVVIIPAHRPHFASYNGRLDRVLIGVNFYALR